MGAESVSELAQLSGATHSHDRIRELQAALGQFDKRLQSWWIAEGVVSVKSPEALILGRFDSGRVAN